MLILYLNSQELARQATKASWNVTLSKQRLRDLSELKHAPSRACDGEANKSSPGFPHCHQIFLEHSTEDVPVSFLAADNVPFFLQFAG